jgi:hypothetical protein
MKFEVFQEIVTLLQKQSNTEQKAYDAGIDLFNFNEPIHSTITHLIGTIYGKDGLDTFNWWCYDKDWGTQTDCTMTDSEGNELCRTLEELYQYLEKNKTTDYQLPYKMSDAERERIIKNMFQS